MNSINALLLFINQNWASIVTCVLLIIGIASKAKNWMKKSEQEKVEIAKRQVREIILRLVTEAEIQYDEWVSAGEIKRSQVICQVLEMYPALSKAIDQEELIKFMDECIDEALVVLRDILETNEKTVVVMEAE